MSFDHVLSLLGLLFGALAGAFGWWWGRKQAVLKRGLDERYETIATKSLAASWKISLGSIFFLFILLNCGIHLSVAPVLGILLLVQMAGWACSTIYYNLKL
jgi:hypothetical protein